MRPASSGGSRGTSGTPCRQNMGIDPSVAIRRVEGAHRKWCRELWYFPRVRPVCWVTLGSHQGCQVPFRTSRRNVGLFLRSCSGQGPHLAKRWEPRGFLELRRDSRLTTGISGFLLGWHWEAQSSPRVARESWGLRLGHCRAEETSSRRESGT